MNKIYVTLAAVLLTPSVATSDTLQVSAGTQINVVSDSGFDAITNDNAQVLGSFTAAYDLGYVAQQWVRLSVEIDYQVGAMAGTVFREIDTSLTNHRLGVGARGSYALVPNVHAVGRVGLGWAAAKLGLSDSATGTAIAVADTDHAVMADIRGGLEIDLVHGTRATLGLRGQIGYQAISEFQFRGVAESRSGTAMSLLIPGATGDLGGLNLSAVTTGMELYARF